MGGKNNRDAVGNLGKFIEILADDQHRGATGGKIDQRLANSCRRAGVDAELQVFEGLSHAQYTINADAPETREAFEEIARFFDRHMER